MLTVETGGQTVTGVLVYELAVLTQSSGQTFAPFSGSIAAGKGRLHLHFSEKV